MSITFDNGGLTIKGSTKAQINASITIAGTGTELPITIVGDFKAIPKHLHQMYIQAMQSSYGNVNVFDRTKDYE
jgi:tRNA(Glu) U13 pseudouridine synthase TruD